MDGLMVCALAGPRRGRGFEPRFVRPSRGPPVRPPPPPPTATRSSIGTAGASGGVSRPHRFLPSSFCSTQSTQADFYPSVGNHCREKRQCARHSTPAAARPTTGTALRRRNRISSSYSSSTNLPQGDSNPRLQGSRRLHSRCGTWPKSLHYAPQHSGRKCLSRQH